MPELLDAIDAFNRGDGAKWCQTYLRGEGRNEKLAERLKAETRLTMRMVEFPLNRLVRIIGPEAGTVYREASETWEGRVSALVDAIRLGAQLAPLIVTDLWEPFGIADGNHRHAALERCGYDTYWTAFLFARPESAESLDAT